MPLADRRPAYMTWCITDPRPEKGLGPVCSMCLLILTVTFISRVVLLKFIYWNKERGFISRPFATKKILANSHWSVD